MMKIKLFALFALACCAAGCTPAVTQEALYGRWKYVKVEHPAANPPDSLSKADLDAAAPVIEFKKPAAFSIMWAGKVLSHGTFSVDGNNINIQESLPDGSTRKFPFWVTSLTNEKIVFETKGDEKSKVTAVKE